MDNLSLHIPVLLNEVVEVINPQDGKIYVDGTFGAGGYSKEVLNKANCQLIAIDRDPNVKKSVDAMSHAYGDRFKFVAGRFGDMKSCLASIGQDKVDGIMLDIGVSSMQIDEADRGFSFRFDGPLDMRMSASGETAADIVNNMPEKDLADLIYKYGEEKNSRRIAKAIVAKRAEKAFETTKELKEVVHSVSKKPVSGIDSATRTFQALRIAVNDELGELERALSASQDLLNDGGILAVVTFHSLEDRIVKNFFKDKCGLNPRPSRYLPAAVEEANPFEGKNKSITAGDEEVKLNPRARSAKLRYAIRKYGVREAAALKNGEV